ncbi:MAG: hypothetical protein ACOX5K_04765 [Bacteroidales bacterium]|jgi:hypothetical protein
MENGKDMERLSSAYTLSDMEIFVFPELFYPLVLANIMSPIIWKWREDPWFNGIENRGFNYKVNRIKQYIIDNYVFNLDLSTWGLTTKTKEIARFRDFFDIDHIKQSNALFGYEGDKYYFDIDIRQHFGLDKYDSDIIPYWKTETVEAMSAFRLKEGYTTGAGECVSLSALYAAAMFIVGRIPLENIFLVSTPLHSQNFICEKEGLITNNRRIVTKNMWFNGTSLSAKARRALENEKVTIVSHISGYIHTLLADATIDKEQYKRFSRKIRDFLSSDITVPYFLNFLRFKSQYNKLFQFECEHYGTKRYIPLEKLFEYERTSRFTIAPETRQQFIGEIECEEFYLSPFKNRILLNQAEEIIQKREKMDMKGFKEALLEVNGELPKKCLDEMIRDLDGFLVTEPRLPEESKNFLKGDTPKIETTDTREDIVNKIFEKREKSLSAYLTVHVFRQMDQTEWVPFIKAAMERNPICFEEKKREDISILYDILIKIGNSSIYDGNRMAQPDEVWNFRSGDGTEKAILLANFIRNKNNDAGIEIIIDNENVELIYLNKRYRFGSSKTLRKKIKINGDEYSES